MLRIGQVLVFFPFVVGSRSSVSGAFHRLGRRYNMYGGENIQLANL